MQQEDGSKPLYSFGKQERICSKIVIEKLIRQRNTFSVYPFKCFYAIEPNPTRTLVNQIMISVPKKTFHSAVMRNKIKRLIREAYRLNKHILSSNATAPPCRYQIFFIFIGNTVPSFKRVNDKIITILQRLSQMPISVQ